MSGSGSSREKVLGKVRSGVAAGAAVVNERTEAERRANVASRLGEHRRHLVPARAAGKSPAELTALLKQWVEMAGGEVIEVGSAEGVPGVISDFLRRHNQPSRLRVGADKRLASLLASGPAQPFEIAKGPAEPADATGVTRALAAVAETGTLVVASGADNPVTLSFLPENNIVVVDRADIVGPLEDAMARLRAGASPVAGGGWSMPRTLNLVSGPSRSADIGGVPVLGAHGPKRLAVIVVG